MEQPQADEHINGNCNITENEEIQKEDSKPEAAAPVLEGPSADSKIGKFNQNHFTLPLNDSKIDSSIPFPNRLKKQTLDKEFSKFIDMFEAYILIFLL